MKIKLTLSVTTRGWTNHYELGPITGSEFVWLIITFTSFAAMGAMLAWRM